MNLGIDFWKFFIAQTISNFGGAFTLFALPLLVYQLSGSAFNLGLATAANFLPYLLFGLALGAFTDRVDRKKLMIVTDVAQGVLIITIPLASFLGILSVWWIYSVGFLGSTLRICSETGQFAALPNLVGTGNLVRANGLLQAGYRTATILGPFAAGAVVAIAAVQTTFFVDGLSFFASALVLSTIKNTFNSAESDDRTTTTLWQDVGEGLRYVLGNPVLRNISIMMALINFVGTTVHSQLVLFSKESLAATDFQVSLLYSAGAAGVVTLSLFAGYLRNRLSFSKASLGAVMLRGLMILAMASISSYWLAVPVWAAASGLAIFFNINTGSLRQQLAPDRMLGRVNSVAMVMAWSAIPLGALLGGIAIELTGDVRTVYGVIGALIFLIALSFSFTALGRAEQYLPSDPRGGLESNSTEAAK